MESLVLIVTGYYQSIFFILVQTEAGVVSNHYLYSVIVFPFSTGIERQHVGELALFYSLMTYLCSNVLKSQCFFRILHD